MGRYRIVGCNWDVTAETANKRALEQAKSDAEAHNAELVAATARIEHTSLHDALTHLPNRRYLDKFLSERAAAEDDSTGIALLHIDLDRFKQINDTLGHAAGDAMLIHAAEVLRSNVREDDFVARIGGDEFVVVSPLRNGRRDLTRLATRIIEEMRQPMPYMGHECRCGVSVGIAFQRGSKVDDKRLLINADIALYRAKRRGRNRYEFFTEALQAEIISTKHMADDILSGIEQGQFVAWYQPQFDARTLEISGVEALARWEHPSRGVVSPDTFMPIAEDLNVVATIDRMILDQTLVWMDIWRAQGLIVPRASVNVSARRLRDENLIKSLKKLDIKPGTISFELVEFDLSRRERRHRRLEHRPDPRARHRHRDRRFRHRLRLDRQPAEAPAAPPQDRPAAGDAHRRVRESAPAHRLDRRHRPLARASASSPKASRPKTTPASSPSSRPTRCKATPSPSPSAPPASNASSPPGREKAKTRAA